MKKTLAAALLSSTLLFGTASVVEAQEQGTESEDDSDDSGKLGLIGLAGLLGLAGLARRDRHDDRSRGSSTRYDDERGRTAGTR